MNKEQVENYITELESMFELSELEEHSRNILKVGIYINKLQQENQELKKQLKELEEHSANAINKQVSRGVDLVNQQKEFIEYLEKTIVDSKAGSGQQYYYQQVLEMYKEIIGDDK